MFMILRGLSLKAHLGLGLTGDKVYFGTLKSAELT